MPGILALAVAVAAALITLVVLRRLGIRLTYGGAAIVIAVSDVLDLIPNAGNRTVELIGAAVVFVCMVALALDAGFNSKTREGWRAPDRPREIDAD